MASDPTILDAVAKWQSMTPVQRFERHLEQFEKELRDRDSGEVMDYSTEQYHSAFHRTVVDHWLSSHPPSHRIRVGEGAAILRQAEIICAALMLGESGDSFTE